MKFGSFEIRTFVEQPFRLDGGTMFGVIPKSMWQRLIPADANNLIPMVTNLFVLTAHDKNMIFDIGLGDTLSDREKKIYGTDGVSAIDTGLASLGLKPTDIDYVILTHLHTDHCGGAVKFVDGQYVARYPNATYIIAKKEWDVFVKPDERTGAVYVPARLHPLNEAGKIQFIDGSTELFPGINAVHSGGHSEGQFVIEMESAGSRVYYYADIYPTIHHMRVPFVPATDVYPLTSMEFKRRSQSRILNQDVILAFDHDTTIPFARIKEVDGKIVAEPVTEATVSTKA
ncbi:MAG: MBL fold metallo-hydrolase [Candidatus Zixiibacteriota bacterium]